MFFVYSRVFAQTIVVLLCSTFAICSSSLNSEDSGNRKTLRFVHAVWRHGDRSPSSGTFPTDVNNTEATWPQGFGELSRKGMEQQFALGQFLRSRYDGFLSQNYSKYEIHVRSSSYNRTIMSAQANLAGLYGRLTGQSFPWQLVPVHSRPREEDPVIWMGPTCPTEKRLFKAVKASEAVRQIERDNKEFFEFLHKQTGSFRENLIDIAYVFDPLNCEKEHSDTHRWPSWVNDSIFDEVVRLYDLSVQFYYPTAEIQRLRGGLLLGEILQRMEQKQKNQTQYLDDRLKFYAYSGHDTTVTAILENFGVFNGRAPPYASCLLVELHQQVDGSHTVELWYRNSTFDETLNRLSMSDCPDPCSLDKLIGLRRHLIPADWSRECGLVPWYQLPAKTYLFMVSGLLSLVLVLLLSTGWLLAFALRRRGNWSRKQ